MEGIVIVNVTNFSSIIPEGDMLETIFKRQQELIDKYHPIEEENAGHSLPHAPVDINTHAGQARLKDFAWRVTEELGEAMNCLKNKPWKQSHMITDEIHYREELADAFHFMIELFVLSGFDATSLTAMYLDKNAVNQFRIRSNY